MHASTTTYIALLRGINVGGHTIKMVQLRELFQELSFTSVRSFIQTGNIFFESAETDRQSLQQRIGQHLAEALGYSVPVCLRTVPELEAVIASNPFHTRKLTSETRFSITFLDRPIPVSLPIPSFTPDNGFELIGMNETELFVIWHLKNGRPGNSYGFEKAVDAQATTRFWHTTEKILAAAKKEVK